MSTSETLQQWTTTNPGNANSDSAIASSDTQAPNTVATNIRSIMTALAKYRLDENGGLTAGGTANALTVTSNQVLQSSQLTAGLAICIKAASANTSATVTFAPDGLTAAAIKRADGSALAVGSITAGMFLALVYNSGTSEWWCANLPPLAGVTDGSNAPAGQIGELLTATASGIALTSTVAANVVTLALTAGDWNVWAGVTLVAAGGNTLSIAAFGLNTVSATLGAAGTTNDFVAAAAQFTTYNLPPPMQRISISAGANVYLVARSTFSGGGSTTAGGTIWARRVR